MNNNLVFISIASYRDTQTQSTVNNLINTATNPNNLRIVVVEQNLKRDKYKVNSDLPKVRVLRNIEGKGPAWARYLATTLYNGEQYFMQIDSHMTFIKGWDTIMKQQTASIQNNHAIFTCYPPPKISEFPVKSITENWSLDHHNHIIAQGKITPSDGVPSLGIFVSAGFIFCGDAELFLREIPYDPNLKYLFQGEEILLSARLFTSGWDVYHPAVCVCSHDYIRENQPKVWKNNPDFWVHNKNAVRKYRYLTQQLKGLPAPTDNIYDCGTVRPIDDWKQLIKLPPEHLFD